MKCHDAVEFIQAGKTALGIEFGSTRIKATLISRTHQNLAEGSFSWENRLENGLWTYKLEDAVSGLQACFADLAADVRKRYDLELVTVGSIGISGMMHGYLPLDRAGTQLAPFLTWRNTNTAEAASALTELFQFNIPLRWSISQLYQAILNNEPHVDKIGYITTLSGYIHFLLTGKRVVGIGDASGMFPVCSESMDFDQKMLDKFRTLIAKKNYSWDIRGILPKVLAAGDNAGSLTAEGARLLDPTGKLRPGIPMAPPEGDAGTGMVATNSVEIGTGNISAGTSIFAMVVLEKNLSRLYRDIDMVTTPNGYPVAMVHCNNGTSELDAWMRLFGEVLKCVGVNLSEGELYGYLFRESLKGDADCDGVLLYNYISGEPITGSIDGRPLLTRRKDSRLSLANFMRTQIYSVIASLCVGLRILEKENVPIRRLTGHGGLFKTVGVAQSYLASAMNSAVTVMNTAGEGGPYGMAVLAAYLLWGKNMTLEQYLQTRVFADAEGTMVLPDPEISAGYASYLNKFCNALALERCAVTCVPEKVE